MDLANFLIQLLNSVQYGLLLFMLAAGLTLIFGIMRSEERRVGKECVP